LFGGPLFLFSLGKQEWGVSPTEQIAFLFIQRNLPMEREPKIFGFDRGRAMEYGYNALHLWLLKWLVDYKTEHMSDDIGDYFIMQDTDGTKEYSFKFTYNMLLDIDQFIIDSPNLVRKIKMAGIKLKLRKYMHQLCGPSLSRCRKKRLRAYPISVGTSLFWDSKHKKKHSLQFFVNDEVIKYLQRKESIYT
jgi:hypothetical protein